MVHKKYIKRGGKVFGPYLYENYREDGVVKTRYLGIGKKESKKINKVLFIALGLIFLIFFLSWLVMNNFSFFGIDHLKGGFFQEYLQVSVEVVDFLPQFQNLQDEIFVCENTALLSFFNVSEKDGIVDSEGNLVLSLSLSDYDPFFLNYGAYNQTSVGAILFSGILNKSSINAKRIYNEGWAVYPETITAIDRTDNIVYNYTEIIILEVNNPPRFDIGPETVETMVWARGDNRNFYYDLGSFLSSHFEETNPFLLNFSLVFLDNYNETFFGIENGGIINISSVGVIRLFPNISLANPHAIIGLNNERVYYSSIRSSNNRAVRLVFLDNGGNFLTAINVSARGGSYRPVSDTWYEVVLQQFVLGAGFVNVSEVLRNPKQGGVYANVSLIPYGEESRVYNLRLCVNDTGLISIPHENSSLCLWGDPPQDRESKQYCDYFSLTITNKNRPPSIIDFHPINLSFDAGWSKTLYFNVSVYDPDYTLPEVVWYVDDTEKQSIENVSFSEFSYVFGCNIYGKHVVRVLATDGLQNVSMDWNLSLQGSSCGGGDSGGGGGGGGGGGIPLFCEERWGCDEWNQCENLKKSIDEGWLSSEKELSIKERCEILNLDEGSCGYQYRICRDYNYCETELNKPGVIRECHYTENPNCEDEIKNCHDGKCEDLVDCGGPCSPCPTCFDGILNQDEERIDCGGSSCNPCEEFAFLPYLFRTIVTYSLIVLFILILILVIKQAIIYRRYRERIKKEYKRVFTSQGNATKIIFFFCAFLLLFLANFFIMNFAKTGEFIPNMGEVGFLASYNFINSFIKNIGFFFASGPIISGNTRLEMWDDTDNPDDEKFSFCSEYCIEKEKPSSLLWTIYFYANYTDINTDAPLFTGDCDIRFQDSSGIYGSWNAMNYEISSGLFEYNAIFDYRGDYNFEVNCSFGDDSSSGEDNFYITNTVPYIFQTAQNYIDFDKDGVKDILQCVEDSVCYYYFASNISEDDANDILFFSAAAEPTNPLTKFKINSSTGVLEINITSSSETGTGKKVRLVVDDGESNPSAVLEVRIQDVNDAPFFVNLDNRTFNVGDLFSYEIQVNDEENNVPFKFNIDFLSCDNEIVRGNCTLFSSYAEDPFSGTVNINFVPQEIDVGSYMINFSVEDTNVLGDKMASMIVNFTVNFPIWQDSLVLNYSLVEDNEFYLNLSELVIWTGRENITFSANSSFFSGNMSPNGVINFTPGDAEVGSNLIEITADDGKTNSMKVFNFSVSNINDSVKIVKPIQNVNGGSVDANSNIISFENTNIEIFLFIDDDDFLVSQKNFYNEELNLSLNIEGMNISLFNFNLNSIFGNRATYRAEFIPRFSDVGDYNVSIYVNDKGNSSDNLKFNLTVLSRPYDTPNITFPDPSYEFNLKENLSSNLTFRVNHTVGDNLSYSVFINNRLMYELSYYGDNRDFIWRFTPNFTEETYNSTYNLSLNAMNPLFPNLNVSRVWNLTINHTNAPVEFIKEISDRAFPYNYVLQLDLADHFSDIDYYDENYKQDVDFVFASDANISYISVNRVLGNWTFTIASLKYAVFSETLNITAYDLNESGGRISNTISNNFLIEFIEPTTVTQPVASSGGGGGGSGSTIISLKIIVPGKVSAFEGEKIKIPLALFNGGKKEFEDLNLSSIAFKNGEVVKEVKTSLDKGFFKSLKPGEWKNFTLEIFFDTDKLGDYEIFVNVSSKTPKYFDWGKININLQAINESEVRDLIVFAEEFIVRNPVCLEIKESIDEANNYFNQGDFVNARIKTEQALQSCEESISQVSLPRYRERFYEANLYLIISLIIGIFALVLGIIYYFFKRWRFSKRDLKDKIKKSPLEGYGGS